MTGFARIFPGGLNPLETTPTALDELVAMAPDVLVSRLRSLAEHLQLAYSAATLRAWRADWRVWTAYAKAADVHAWPVTLADLKAFLQAQISAGKKRATLERYLSTLALVHRLAAVPWVLETLEGRLLWRGLRRSLTARQRQVRALTLADVDLMLAPLSAEKPIDVRDAALLTVAYETMCRRSELVALALEQISPDPDGSARVLIARSKTDQEGEGALLYLSPDTVGRVQCWVRLAGISTGALFRSASYTNRREAFEKPLTEGDVARIFRRRALAAGLDPAGIAAHSTRVGAAQDLLAANFSSAAVMRQGRWRSERMVIRYSEHLEAGRGAMAQWLKRKATE